MGTYRLFTVSNPNNYKPLISCVYKGATENAGVENVIRSKMQWWKMQE